jgi:hypothetical protein
VAKDHLDAEVNVPDDDLAQYTSALGAAILGHRRLQKMSKVDADAA